MPLMRERSSANWAGNPERPSRPACGRRSAGIWKTTPGSKTSPAAVIASGLHLTILSSDREPNEPEFPIQGHHPGRRVGHAPLSGDDGDWKEPVAGLQQADDLLPSVYPDAGGNPRDPDHFDARGSAPVRTRAAGWKPVRNSSELPGATEAGGHRAGLPARGRVSQRKPVRIGAGG